MKIFIENKKGSRSFGVSKVSRISVILMLICLIPSISSFAQGKKQVKTNTISATILNSLGEPIEGVKIEAFPSGKNTITNESGEFSLKVNVTDVIKLKADGYKPVNYKTSEFLSEMVMDFEEVFVYNKDEEVNVAFGLQRSRLLSGDVSVINPSDFSSFDITQNVGDAINARVPGMLNATNIRGLGNALIVVDGIPRGFGQLNLMEVEQVTILKGAHAAVLYGEEARNGVILVTTKRGKIFEKEINVTAEYGVSTPRTLPQYLNSAQYMELHNEALANDGLAARFNDEQIQGSRDQTNPYRYPSVDYYSSEFLADVAPSARVLTEFSGGNERSQYYAHFGWVNNEGLPQVGNQRQFEENILRVRANVDFKVSENIKASVDVASYLQTQTGFNTNFWNYAANYHPYYFSPLIPVDQVTNQEDILNAELINGQYILGGTNQFQNNVYGDFNLAGNNNLNRSNTQFNNGIDFDLNKIADGLTARTYVSFDYQTFTSEEFLRNYAVYNTNWQYGADSLALDSVTVTQIGDDSREQQRRITGSNFNRNLGFYALLNYNKRFQDHAIDATFLGYTRNFQTSGAIFDSRSNHLGFRLNYVFKDKYIADFSGAYVSADELPEKNRVALSPSIALGWIISEESFVSGLDAIDFLKLNLTAGIINFAGVDQYYLYEDAFSGNGFFGWADGIRNGQRTVLNVNGNPNLGFSKRVDINVGLEAVILNKSVGLSATYFNTELTELPEVLNSVYPAYLGNTLPTVNNGSNRYRGIDLGINWQKQFGELNVQLGGNMVYLETEVLKTDELNAFDYLNRTGNRVDARFGLESLGFFENEGDIQTSPFQTYGNVQPGDLKYKDQNADGVIDDLDRVLIGNFTPDLNYGLNMTLKYRGFTLFAIGNGQLGSDTYRSGSYFRADQNAKYSEEVLNRWTPATAATATYPRLTSQDANNNHQNSTFWLRDNNFFRLQRVQLGYELPESLTSAMRIQNMNIYIRGYDVLTISKYQHEIDLNIGSSPQMRSFAIGLIAGF